ncbi:hypothetical protein PPYR_05838 [Photinus pyralis]|nr:hypothetical protein PPYR_05838 [Photinus pyralis]
MMSDPGPPVLVWLPLLHRISSVENVVHPVQCDACQRENFTGFRYRCQKCPHYVLCQDCFWRGRVTTPHTLDHQVKEYASYSPSKTIGHSLRKSFRCVPDKQKNNLPRFPEQPEKTLNLSHIVPPSPIPSHNGFPDGPFNFDGMGSLDSRTTARSLDSARDDEHRLIARYAAKLAQEARTGMGRVPSEACLGMDSTRAQRELINQLEAKNREIMREIARLRRQQEIESSGHGSENPALMSELRALRMRKDELEAHLTTLQDSRRQLMIQLEGLMKMLKNHQSSPRSTPNSSPRSTKSPPLPPGALPNQQPCPRSAPQTPLGMPPSIQPVALSQVERNSHIQHPSGIIAQSIGGMGGVNSMAMDRNVDRGLHNVNTEALMGVGGDVRNAFGGNNGNDTPGSVGRSLRNDLLVAADSVTNAMSTLVRELNSDFEDDGEEESEGGWQQELQRRYAQEASFMAELRARHPTSPPEITQNNQGYVMGQNFNHNSLGQLNSNHSSGQQNYIEQNPGLFGSQPQQHGEQSVNTKESEGDVSNATEATEEVQSENKSKEMLEWEEAVKRWINR